jgi:hypothetical protein
LQVTKQHCLGFVESPRKKVTQSSPHYAVRHWIARIQPLRCFEVFNRKIGLPGPQSEKTTPTPGASRVEFQGTVDRCERRIEIVAEVSEHMSNPAQGASIIICTA